MLRWTRAALAAAAAAAAVAGRGHAQMHLPSPEPARWESSAARVVLDVPFVAQERLLCGAAAVEMALRHAGARGVYARDFAALVREEEGGIRTDELAAAVGALGWEVRAGASDLRLLEADLAEGRPATVLLAERPGRYHYVLVVGSTRDSVVVHDPGRKPGLSVPLDDFLSRWEDAGRWSLVVLSERAAGTGDVAAADPPREAAPPHALLERASELFREERWKEAADAAREAADADPSDGRAWSLLATSSYLAGDTRSALDAWGRDRPLVVDRVAVTGLERTRHPVVHELIGLRPGEPLRLGSLDHARRRLSLLPSAERVSLSYRALPAGLAVVEGVVSETAAPLGRARWVAAAVSAVASSEVRVALPGFTGGGEGSTVHARWAVARPGAGVTLAVPMQRTVPGVLEIGVSWEAERHALEGGESPHVEARTKAHVALTDWASAWLRWKVGGGVERWRNFGNAATARVELELSPPAGGASLVGAIDASSGRSAATRYVRWTVEGSVEPLPSDGAWRVGVRALAAGVDADAPRIAMPGADVGRAREGLLRAHSMEGNGALSPLTLGRGLLNASIELERRILRLPFSGVGAAVFVDAARVSGALATTAAPEARGFIDAGIGLRLRAPSGVVRLDVARGDDGSRALTLGWRAGAPRPDR